jgi:sorting nexin-4
VAQQQTVSSPACVDVCLKHTRDLPCQLSWSAIVSPSKLGSLSTALWGPSFRGANGRSEKVTVRVARRQADLEQDYADLATQCQKLTTLEPAVENTLTSFAASVTTTSQGFKSVKEHTDQNYLTSLRDMDAYILALRNLLRTREGKQLDFEALSEYLAKSAADRDSLASQHGAGMGASGFLRSKVEDFRGIDHDQARRQRVRKLEVEIERLTGEVENSKKATEAFDEHTVKEVADFERIKAVEFKDTLGDLADAHINFFQGTIETWEKFLEDMRKEEDERKAAVS